MEPQTVAFLAKEYPNIVALKQSCGDLDLVSEIRSICPEDFAIYSGDDSLTLPMLSLGAHGVVSVASHIVGNEIKSMIRNYKSGQVGAARNMHMKLFPLFKKLFMAPNPIPVKAACAAMGYCDNYLRLPLTPMEPQNEAKLLAAMKNAGVKF